jgi:hypothetical protein
LCGDLAPEGSRVDVVDEGALPVDLYHREPFPVALLEFACAADIDLVELDPLGPQHLPRPLAEVAALRVVERDASYG